MASQIIAYLLSLRRQRTPIVSDNQTQVVIPNFPALMTISYSLAPAPMPGFIVYEYRFGEAMIPGAFDAKIQYGGGYIFNALVTGQYTTNSTDALAIVGLENPAIQITTTNTTPLIQYFELCFSFLGIPDAECYKLVLDALRRVYTSQQVERLLSEIAVSKTPGGRR